MSAEHAHVTAAVIEQATGAIEAQKLVDAIRAGRLEPTSAWHCFAELQARHGKNAPALRSFIVYLAKHASQQGAA